MEQQIGGEINNLEKATEAYKETRNPEGAAQRGRVRLKIAREQQRGRD